MARVYTELREESQTVPELDRVVSVSRVTVYDYVEQLANAGLVREVDSGARADAYEAVPFRVTLEIDGDRVALTPDVVRVVATRDESPELDDLLDRYGVGTLARFVSLVHDHAAGEVTTRQIATALDVPEQFVFSLIGHLYGVLEIGDGVKIY